MAVKTLTSEADVNDRVKFLREGAINGQFRHRNVVRLHGVVTIGSPVIYVSPLLLLLLLLLLLCVVIPLYNGQVGFLLLCVVIIICYYYYYKLLLLYVSCNIDEIGY